ncbi:MAG: hypothetical protein P8J86_02375, partial [Phycisphaerales bacterium]|nr:hypothetical protein [Phycisphaerales bacterium]
MSCIKPCKSVALTAIATSLFVTTSLQADPISMQVDSEMSSAFLDTSLSLVMNGTFLGDHDEETNPEGTMTRPGLFGGSGNQPVTTSVTPRIEALLDSNPVGSMDVELDFDLGTILITNTQLDLLGDSTGSMPLSIVLEFVTFRTYNPGSLFIGGFSLPIPIGSGSLTTLTFEQSELPSPGLLTETAPGQYDFGLLIPGQLTLGASLLDQEIATPGLPMPLLLLGSIEVSTDGVTMTLSLAESFEDALDLSETLPPIENIPFPLPTILPPGGIANLLVSAQPMNLEAAIAIAGDLIIFGEMEAPNLCPEDINGDGFVDLADFSDFLVNFGATGENPADINGDLVVDLVDFSAF